MTRSAPLSNPHVKNIHRDRQRHAFLKGHVRSLIALPADASKRQYFRYEGGLLMDAPSPENPAQFMRVADYLRSLEFSAPQILNHDLPKGFLAVEDFGDATYTKLLQAGEDPYPLYDLAVDTLVALHQRATACPEFIASYDVDALVREAGLFVDWYMPAMVKKTLPLSDKQAYLDLWAGVFEKALRVPHSLVLRDYHVDNLMRLKERSGVGACGLLDFQEALWGPVVYDLVSLLEDARLDLEPALINHCWQRYLAAFPSQNEETLRTAGCILSAGRHAKIMGVFTRLAVRDGKPSYLRHLPRIWRLLQTCLNHPDLSQIKAWFEDHGGTQAAV
ncbi:MAG: Aminoglycoside phosphotransferase [Alphaproteobacteria bacterium]|jgi:aminoglycoside/choline kinase family phosphotransferase|nr:Aminoglycoside phosphotransferase [Alphaproteobacteria bacterium]MDF3034431.1 Aminoglycoside phosphotransferase [Alphaproteobacteria bacterium]